MIRLEPIIECGRYLGSVASGAGEDSGNTLIHFYVCTAKGKCTGFRFWNEAVVWLREEAGPHKECT